MLKSYVRVSLAKIARLLLGGFASELETRVSLMRLLLHMKCANSSPILSHQVAGCGSDRVDLMNAVLS
jgi:hypothetical protein